MEIDAMTLSGVKQRAEDLIGLIAKSCVETHLAYYNVIDGKDGNTHLKTYLQRLLTIRGMITSQIETIQSMLGVKQAPSPEPAQAEDKPETTGREITIGKTTANTELPMPELTSCQKLAVVAEMTGSLTNSQVQTMMSCDPDQAREYIQKLVNHGVLVKASSKLYTFKARQQ